VLHVNKDNNQPTNRGPLKRLAGVSFVEFVIVFAILGILGSIGFVNIRRDKPQVNETARIIASDLLWARSEAIRRNTNVAVSFDVATDKYQITTQLGTEGATSTKALLNRNLTNDFPLADIIAIDFSSDSTVVFDSQGLPRLVDADPGDGSITVISHQDDTYKVTINLATQGKVQVAYP